MLRARLSRTRTLDTIRETNARTRAPMEVNERMTANWASAVVNTLVLAFFVVIGIGIALGVYAARALKKAEQMMQKTQ